MQEISLKVEKVVGPASSAEACGIFRKNVQFNDSLGALISCFSLKSEGEDDTQVILGDLFEIVSKKFEEARDEGPLTLLRDAASSISNYINGKEIKLSFVNLLFCDDACYFSKAGNEVKFFVFDPPKKLEITYLDGSGPTSNGQIYLLATAAFLSTFDVDELSDEDKEVDLEGIIDEVATAISNDPKKAEIAAAFIQVKTEGSSTIVNTTQISDEESASKVETEEVSEEAAENTEVEEKTEFVVVGDNLNSPEGVDKEQKRGSKTEFLKDTRDNLISYTKVFFRKFSKELVGIRRGEVGAVLRLRKNLGLFAIAILLVLLASGVFAYRGRQNIEKRSEAASHIATADTKFSEAVAILGLNKSRARELLVEADKEVKAAIALDAKNEKANKLASSITDKLKETESLSNVSFKTVLDKQGTVVGLSISDKNLYAVYDKKIYSILLSGGKETEEAELDGASDGLVSLGDAVVSNGNTVEKIKLADGKKEKIGNVASLRDIGVFISNVYVLSENQIKKFVPVASGYTAGGDYLGGKVDFDAGARMVIDGNVWVSSGQKIYKFLRGETQNFEISGLIGNTSAFGEIYTSAEMDNLYVIDKANSALLVISKDGVYRKAYQASEFGQAKGIAVDDSETNIYIATGNKVIVAPL